MPEGAAIISTSWGGLTDTGQGPSDIDPPTLLRAPCQALAAWGLECVEQTLDAGGLTARVPVLIRDGLIDAGSDLMIVPAQTSMQVWSERAEDASVHLVSTTGRSLDLRAIERLLHALAPVSRPSVARRAGSPRGRSISCAPGGRSPPARSD